jgi:hypothetical protein
MIFSCVVPFERKKKKIPDLSLPPCIYQNLKHQRKKYRLSREEKLEKTYIFDSNV